MNIIEEIYYGNLDPQETNSKADKRACELINTIDDKEKALTECLDGYKKKLLLELLNANSEFVALMEIKRFMAGWRLGAKFMLDTLSQEY